VRAGAATGPGLRTVKKVSRRARSKAVRVISPARGVPSFPEVHLLSGGWEPAAQALRKRGAQMQGMRFDFGAIKPSR